MSVYPIPFRFFHFFFFFFFFFSSVVLADKPEVKFWAKLNCQVDFCQRLTKINSNYINSSGHSHKKISPHSVRLITKIFWYWYIHFILIWRLAFCHSEKIESLSCGCPLSSLIFCLSEKNSNSTIGSRVTYWEI